MPYILLSLLITTASSLPCPSRSRSHIPNHQEAQGAASASAAFASAVARKNPISDGWYADPDGIKVGSTYWIYATVSVAFPTQGSFDAFSSTDLAQGNWEPHPSVFTSSAGSQWAKHSFWAPCVVERAGKFYLYYTANNPVEAAEAQSGIGVAVADTPGGPFVDLVDGPIVGTRVNGANPMDQMVFRDDDGATYLIWGGSAANIAPLEDDMVTLGAWKDNDSGEKELDTAPRNITPNEGYGEGPYMLKHAGHYYLMWSEGGYGTPDYRVAYAVADAVTGPFVRRDVILQKDGVVADGPGHHSIIRDDAGGYWIVYHRRIIGDTVADHRVVAVDRFEFADDGSIRPVVMT